MHAHCVWLIEMNALCIWAFTKVSAFDRQSIRLWWKEFPSIGRSISYFLRRQPEEKQHCSPGKWSAFHYTFIPPSFICVYLSIFLSPPLVLSSVCFPLCFEFACLVVYLYSFLSLLSTGGRWRSSWSRQIYAISAQSVRKESYPWLDYLCRTLQRKKLYLKAIKDISMLYLTKNDSKPNTFGSSVCRLQPNLCSVYFLDTRKLKNVT